MSAPESQAYVTLKGCCECRACAFCIYIARDLGQEPMSEVINLDVIECHCPACRKHSAAAYVAWIPARDGHAKASCAVERSARLMWVAGRAPKKVKATCSGHEGAVNKIVCPECFSIMALEPLDSSGIVEANLGCVILYDYFDQCAARE